MNDREVMRLSAALGALAILAALAVAVSLSPTVRAPLVLGALVSCPGWAVMSRVKAVERSLMWAAALGLSCALVILVSLGLVAARLWYPRTAVTVLLLAAAAALTTRADFLRREATDARSPQRGGRAT
jgi:hypothetical protein